MTPQQKVRYLIALANCRKGGMNKREAERLAYQIARRYTHSPDKGETR